MPIPIQKVKDMKMESQDIGSVDLSSILPFFQTNPFLLIFKEKTSKEEKEAMKEMWLKSVDEGNNKLRVSSEMSPKNLSLLQSKGFINGKGDLFEITQSGKKVLRESILDEEESAFCKQASKQLVSKNSFDFGDKVLVKVGNPEKFGTKYITISKESFNKKKIKPKTFNTYAIKTTKENGEIKKIKDYTEEELIQVLHLSKKIIKNASKIALSINKSVPVNRIRFFADMVMTEINSR